MAFTVVHPNNSQKLWAPVAPSDTIYTGAIIGVNTNSLAAGVIPMPVPAGAANVTNLDAPLGVVTGNNNTSGNVLFDSTYNAEYITAGAESASYGSTTQYQGVEGPMGNANDRWAMVEYIPITAETVLKGPLYNAAVGTALTVGTVTTASGADGLDCTTNAVQCTPVANLHTIYYRTGANAGLYRQGQGTSATALENSPACMSAIAVGDTVVVANLPHWGTGRAYIDTEGLYIDASAGLSTNYLLIDVIRLELSEAGNEYCEFRFNPVNFNIIDRTAV
jgi:hypothetical protein